MQAFLTFSKEDIESLIYILERQPPMPVTMELLTRFKQAMNDTWPQPPKEK